MGASSAGGPRNRECNTPHLLFHRSFPAIGVIRAGPPLHVPSRHLGTLTIRRASHGSPREHPRLTLTGTAVTPIPDPPEYALRTGGKESLPNPPSEQRQHRMATLHRVAPCNTAAHRAPILIASPGVTVTGHGTPGHRLPSSPRTSRKPPSLTHGCADARRHRPPPRAHPAIGRLPGRPPRACHPLPPLLRWFPRSSVVDRHSRAIYMTALFAGVTQW
jgi:hypothetical protein